MGTTDTPLIEVRDLDVSFRTRSRTVHAVHGIDLTIEPGQCLALVGESGSGKSVTARTLVGLTGSDASVRARTFTVAGREVSHFSDRQWRNVRGSLIGLVLQDALSSLDPLRTVGAEISETLQAHRSAARRERSARVVELLGEVGVPDPQVRAAQYPHELSGGLRQRALIASAIAGDPRLIIADEPTTALDVTVQAQVLNLLRQRKAEGTALLVISHDLAVVAQLADRVAVMRSGEIVEEGPADHVLLTPRHPYTRELLAAVPSSVTRGRRLSGDVGAPLATATVHPDEVVLEASHVVKTFRTPGGGQRLAVDDISVSLAKGEKLGIVGESGSGKTTLARLLLGLVAPDSGEVNVHGTSWQAIERHRETRGLRHRVQFVAQDPLGSFDPRYRVGEIIAEPLRIAHTDLHNLRKRVTALLSAVQLDPEVAAVHPRELSGGQRQRVSIARSLAVRPDVLICDEPVSALDVSVQAQVLDLLAELCAQEGTSLIFISHDLGVVHHLVDRVLVMRDGKVVEGGDVGEVFTHPTDSYTQDLVRAIPRLPVAA